MNHPNTKGNPRNISVYLLIISYFVGEFIFPKYPTIYILKLLGILCLIISVFIFFSSFNLFKSYSENPLPNSQSKRLIKTGIYAYARNPIYISFILFHLSMFLVFENVMYFISSIGLSVWIHNYIVVKEEKYLKEKFGDEFIRYCDSVKRWLFF